MQEVVMNNISCANITSIVFIVSLVVIFLSLLGIVCSTNALAIDDVEYQSRYRGFYWFEEKSQNKARYKSPEQQKEAQAATFESLSAEEAMNNISKRKENLEQAKSVMLELSFRGASREEIYKAVRHYKILEKEMRRSGAELSSAWEMINFTNPEFIDLINIPVNAHANRVKRRHEKEQQFAKIKDFATQYDLVLFERDDCPYCKEFKPILARFVKFYGFSLDVVGSDSEHVNLAKTLQIESAPTLVAVRKDGKEAFELIRGLVTLSELENNVIFATELQKANYEFASKIK
jgi:thiol-disulfide isomerase/thioredoxin